MKLDEITLKYNKSPIEGDIYTKSNLKLNLDNLLGEYLTYMGYKQSFLYDNIKILISMATNLISGVIYLLVNMYEYKQISNVCYYLLILYGVLSVLYYLNLCYFDMGMMYFKDYKFYSSISDDGTYLLLIYRRDKFNLPKKFIKSVFDLFDDQGILDHNLFLTEVDKKFKEINH